MTAGLQFVKAGIIDALYRKECSAWRIFMDKYIEGNKAAWEEALENRDDCSTTISAAASVHLTTVVFLFL